MMISCLIMINLIFTQGSSECPLPSSCCVLFVSSLGAAYYEFEELLCRQQTFASHLWIARSTLSYKKLPLSTLVGGSLHATLRLQANEEPLQEVAIIDMSEEEVSAGQETSSSNTTTASATTASIASRGPSTSSGFSGGKFLLRLTWFVVKNTAHMSMGSFDSDF